PSDSGRGIGASSSQPSRRNRRSRRRSLSRGWLDKRRETESNSGRRFGPTRATRRRSGDLGPRTALGSVRRSRPFHGRVAQAKKEARDPDSRRRGGAERVGAAPSGASLQVRNRGGS